MTLGGLRAGCTEGLSFAVEAGSLLSQCWVGYNGSLLCLGHFREKFSSLNVQPASLAHG